MKRRKLAHHSLAITVVTPTVEAKPEPRLVRTPPVPLGRIVLSRHLPGEYAASVARVKLLENDMEQSGRIPPGSIVVRSVRHRSGGNMYELMSDPAVLDAAQNVFGFKHAVDAVVYESVSECEAIGNTARVMDPDKKDTSITSVMALIEWALNAYIAGDLPDLIPMEQGKKFCFAPSCYPGRKPPPGYGVHPYNLQDLARLLYMLRPNGNPSTTFRAAVGCHQLVEDGLLSISDLQRPEAPVTPAQGLELVARAREVTKFWYDQMLHLHERAEHAREAADHDTAASLFSSANRLDTDFRLGKAKQFVAAAVEHYAQGGGIRDLKKLGERSRAEETKEPPTLEAQMSEYISWISGFTARYAAKATGVDARRDLLARECPHEREELLDALGSLRDVLDHSIRLHSEVRLAVDSVGTAPGAGPRGLRRRGHGERA